MPRSIFPVILPAILLLSASAGISSPVVQPTPPMNPVATGALASYFGDGFETADLAEAGPASSGRLVAAIARDTAVSIEGPAVCFSEDYGATWSDPTPLRLPQIDGAAYHHVNLARLADGRLMLVLMRVTSGEGGIPAVCFSSDGGHSWTPPRRMLDGPERNILTVTGANITALPSGRIVVPYHQADDFTQNNFRIGVLTSDDGGQTWAQGAPFGGVAGAVEPRVVALPDGSLVLLIRTRAGAIYRSLSSDQGDSWTPPIRTALTSPWAAFTARSLGGGRLLVVWDHNPPNGTGWPDNAFPRDNLSASISGDAGETWSEPVPLVGRAAAVSGQAAAVSEPSALVLDDRLVITWSESSVDPFSANPGDGVRYAVFPAVPTPAAIDAGGPAAGSFAADTAFSGGSTYSVKDPINTSVSGATLETVYQTERYGQFTYTLTGLTPGAPYTLTLHFAEIYWEAAGQRIFNVTANGQSFLSNFDILQTAGGKNKALVRTGAVTADTNGKVTVSFAPTASSPDQNAKVSGLEIAPSAPAVTLLTNGGFENGATDWSLSGASVVSSDAHSGASSVKITGSGAGCYRTVTGLTPGTTYALSGFLKADGVGGDDAHLFVQNADGTYTQTAPVTGTAYAAASLTFTTAANQTSAPLGVWKDAGTGNAWADDLTLTAK